MLVDFVKSYFLALKHFNLYYLLSEEKFPTVLGTGILTYKSEIIYIICLINVRFGLWAMTLRDRIMISSYNSISILKEKI